MWTTRMGTRERLSYDAEVTFGSINAQEGRGRQWKEEGDVETEEKDDEGIRQRVAGENTART